MYEQLNVDLTPQAASAVFGLALGWVFGVFAQRSQFCLRRALVETKPAERLNAQAVWFIALAAAVLGTQLCVFFGLIEFSEHRFHAAGLPLAAIIVGGVLFGVGMVLTRGCASRLSVLAGTGNMRAVFVLLVFAIAAHATLKGVLTPIRIALTEYSLESSLTASLNSNPFAIVIIASLLICIAVWAVRRSSLSNLHVLYALIIGLLVPLAWVGTGYVLQDDFDPIAIESLSFTSSSADWLFWSVASTSIGAGFGVGLLSGVVLGSAMSALLMREFDWVTFESVSQTRRYLVGGVLMGVGGVLAGGCTVGAGLSGVSTLSVSAAIALLSIVFGAVVTNKIVASPEVQATAV